MRHLLLLITLLYTAVASAQLGNINTASRNLVNQGYELETLGDGWKSYRQEVQYREWDRIETNWHNEDGSIWLNRYSVVPTYISRMNGQWSNATFKNFTAKILKDNKKNIRKGKLTWRERYEIPFGDEIIIRETVYNWNWNKDFRVVVRVVRSRNKEKVTTGDGNVHYRYRFKIEKYVETRQAGAEWPLDIAERSRNNDDNPF